MGFNSKLRVALVGVSSKMIHEETITFIFNKDIIEDYKKLGFDLLDVSTIGNIDLNRLNKVSSLFQGYKFRFYYSYFDGELLDIIESCNGESHIVKTHSIDDFDIKGASVNFHEINIINDITDLFLNRNFDDKSFQLEIDDINALEIIKG